MATITARDVPAIAARAARRERSPFVAALLSLRRNPLAMAGIVVIVVWLVIALVAPVIAPHQPNQQDIVHRLQPPNGQHFFGTDDLGRDIFSRVLYGARVSLPAAFFTVLVTGTIGVILGAFAGYVGGVVDNVIMRAADAILAFPSIVLAMAITAVRGGPGLSNALVAVIFVLWPEYARVMRGAVLSLKGNEYVTAAEAVGANRRRILMRHILPGTDAPIVIKATLDIGAVVILMSGLSFLGLGAVPPNPEWGAMLNASISKFQNWWLGSFPALAIISVVLALNFVGDGLRDALDPRLRGR
jgi:peptide/nickel transport system permease protein